MYSINKARVLLIIILYKKNNNWIFFLKKVIAFVTSFCVYYINYKIIDIRVLEILVKMFASVMNILSRSEHQKLLLDKNINNYFLY